MIMKINLSLAAYPTLTYVDAMLRAQAGASEPLLGTLALEHTQLCPQNRGILDEAMAEGLMVAFPETKFRLHANVRVLGTRWVHDLADYGKVAEFWTTLGNISRLMKAPCYTAHAGARGTGTLQDVFDNARRCADLFGIPVGIEGHYPTKAEKYHIDSWVEYTRLYESGIPYVIDFSHLHILASISGETDMDLIREMLTSERCLEVHLSGNDGTHDQHKELVDEPWWWELMSDIHPSTTIFTEGVQPRQ